MLKQWEGDDEVAFPARIPQRLLRAVAEVGRRGVQLVGDRLSVPCQVSDWRHPEPRMRAFCASNSVSLSTP
jgi:hypothetical protein